MLKNMKYFSTHLTSISRDDLIPRNFTRYREMKKISVRYLNNLFSFLEHQPASVLWIRSNNYERQLYVNNNFEKIWGHPTEVMYADPTAFSKMLVTEDKDMSKQIVERQSEDDESCIYLYRIRSKEGEVKFIKDWHYLLVDDEERPLGFAGFAQTIPEQQWEMELQQNLSRTASDPNASLQKYIFGILKNELHLQIKNPKEQTSTTPKSSFKIMTPNNENIDLTEREIECLTHLMQGKSAKQTAGVMNISVRTVEFHLNNAKLKASCRTKIELLGKIVGTT